MCVSRKFEASLKRNTNSFGPRLRKMASKCSSVLRASQCICSSRLKRQLALINLELKRRDLNSTAHVPAFINGPIKPRKL